MNCTTGTVISAIRVPITAPMLPMKGIRLPFTIRFTTAPAHTLFTKI